MAPTLEFTVHAGTNGVNGAAPSTPGWSGEWESVEHNGSLPNVEPGPLPG